MQIKINVSGSIVESREYVDKTNGNKVQRTIATVGGFVDGGVEMVTAKMYLDSAEDAKSVPQKGLCVVEVLNYERTNALSGVITALAIKPIVK